jgi:serine protease AprX
MRLLPLAGLFVVVGLTTTSTSASDLPLDADTVRLLSEHGQGKVWVFFEDKDVDDLGQALSEARASLPERTVARRAARRTSPGIVDAKDFPVAPAYRQAVADTGARVHVESRWLNALSATVDAEQARAIQSLPFVSGLRPVARSTGVSATPEKLAAAYAGALDYGLATDQTEMIDLDLLHGLGHTGDGVVIGVLDTGFVTTHDVFNQPGSEIDILAAYDFVNDDSDVGIEAGDDPDQHFHGTLILGTLAANMPGSLVGAAYDATYILCKTEDFTDEYEGEEDFYVAGLEFAELNGADVVSSSLGYVDWYTQSDLDGLTAPVTVAVNVATGNGVHCCTAAGNDEHDTDPATSALIAPGDAFEVLTVGAVEPTGEVAYFSSDGPTADGRPKPEVLAMGDQTGSIWPYDDVSLATSSGTSLSTPIVAGVVACLVEAHPEWSVASMRERLTKTADYFGEPQPDPLFITGWGILDCDAALALAGTSTGLGGGIAGTAGMPQIANTGTQVGDEPGTLDVTSALPFGSAFLVIGLSLLDAQFKGGVLKPSVDILLSGLALDGSGALSLPYSWVPGVPSGVGLYVQAWIPDGAAVKGQAATEGIAILAP